MDMSKLLVLKRGVCVMIYQDPVTKLKEEGKAYLRSRVIAGDDNMEFWNVEFINEPGPVYMRWIDKRSPCIVDPW